MSAPIKITELVIPATLASGGTGYSDIINLELDYRPKAGFYSLDLKFTTATNGTLSMNVVCRNSSSTFSVPYELPNFATGLAAGTYFVRFSVPPCKEFKVQFIAATADIALEYAWLAYTA